jgi:hypothetical protein
MDLGGVCIYKNATKGYKSVRLFVSLARMYFISLSTPLKIGSVICDMMAEILRPQHSFPSLSKQPCHLVL